MGEIHTYLSTSTEVNQELSVSRAQETKQREFISELENKLEELEKKNRHQLAMNNRSSTPDFDPYNARQSRVPRNSSASNPVKMVQDMVGRVRVSHCYVERSVLTNIYRV